MNGSYSYRLYYTSGDAASIISDVSEICGQKCLASTFTSFLSFKTFSKYVFMYVFSSFVSYLSSVAYFSSSCYDFCS